MAEQGFNQIARQVRRSLNAIVGLLVAAITVVIYPIIAPEPAPDQAQTQQEMVIEDDFDKIENGIHLRTGLKDGPGLMLVVNNCTACHSAKLITQNRMNEERWNSTIKWMQETQNLWDLGDNQSAIVNYLVTQYPPKSHGRRLNLSNIEWYKLEQ